MSNSSYYLKEVSQLLREKDFSTAIGLLKKSLKEHPRHEILTGMLASCYQEIGMHNDAQALYQQIIQWNPENFLAIHQLGLIEFHRGHWAEALAIWADLLLRNDDFVTKYYAAICSHELGRKEDAHLFIHQAQQLTPKDHPIYAEVLKVRSLLDD